MKYLICNSIFDKLFKTLKGVKNLVKVIVNDNNVEQALRIVKKKGQKEGLFKEVKERQRFTKPAEMNKRRKNEAVRRERKRQWKEKQIIGF